MSTPTLFVAGMLHNDELPDLHSHYWDKVYDPFILYKTWEQLRERTKVTLPDDIDPLVQTVYEDGDVRLELSETAKAKIATDHEIFTQEQLVDLKDSKNAVISHIGKQDDLQLRDAAESREEDDSPDGRTVALTRKGEASTLVIPLYKLGQDYFLDDAGQKPYDFKKPLELFLRSVRLSRISVVGSSQPKRYIPSALENYNKKEGIDKDFAAWREHALLRSCVPLVLDENSSLTLGKTRVSLSSELGICYHILS
jgi:CRISPR-associated endonuclease/helicase Cas3